MNLSYLELNVIFYSVRARAKMAAKIPLLGMVLALVNACVMDMRNQLLVPRVVSVRTSKCISTTNLKTRINLIKLIQLDLVSLFINIEDKTKNYQLI